MQSAPALPLSQSRGAIGVETVSLQAGLRNMIARAAHSLPSQGPITAFVHHNTLHALEDLPFEQAVLEGAKQYGCQAYLTEQQYREQLERGRIRVQDLEAVLAADLGDGASRLVACFGTRYSLRLAMLRFPLHHVPDAELRWLIEETDALNRFREEIDVQVRQQMVDQTRRWLMQTLVPGSAPRGSEILKSLRDPFGEPRTSESWSCSKWESFVLRFLWRVCRQGVQAAEGVSGKQTSSSSASRTEDQQPVPLRHRDLLLAATGKDTDHLVHDILIRFCASYLDQGFATSALPDRELGFLTAFAHLYSLRGAPVPSWAKGLRRELREMLRSTRDPLESIGDSLDRLGVDESERQAFLSQTLLALPGWAGIIQQVEGPASWVPRPAPAGTLHEAVVFVGAYHNTCDDSMTWYELDRIPASHRRAFERARDAILEACKRDAHERARRFESAGASLSHNITSLLGVMDGALSDLRTGLPWQMVEIHEPVRLLFVVETTPATMLRIVEANPPIKRLVDGGWIQLTVLDAERGVVHWFSEGTFKAYHTESDELPEVDSSAQWYRGRRDHLGFASVRERATPPGVDRKGVRHDRG